MSFQIRTVILYPTSGEKRVLQFRLGALNVVTGSSKTGKSSILDIIDYCLGSSDYPVAAGVVRDRVRAFALLLQRGSDDGLLVARMAPRDGREVSSQFHIRALDPDGDLPELSDLVVNSDLETAKSNLARFAGIEENVVDAVTTSGRPLRATIRHSLFFCLQAQDEVASRSILFHGQADERVPQAIRDVIPFFLGAMSEDHLAKANRLRQVRGELRVLKRGASERSALQGPSGRAQALVAEAVQVGLLAEGLGNAPTSALDLLAEAMGAPEPLGESLGPPAVLGLGADRQRLRDEYAKVNATLANLRVLSSERGQFAEQADEQLSRLSVAAMFSAGPAREICPLCASELAEEHAHVERIAEAVAALRIEMSAISTTTPELDTLIRRNEERLLDLEAALRENRLAMDEAVRAQDLLAGAREAAVRRAVVRGRISLFLGSQSESVADAAIDERISFLESEAAALEAEVDSDESAARLDSALSRVNSAISTIANDLKLEHSGSPTRLDIRRLTVIADSESGPVALNRMGSGENWLGYHLAAMLGLQRFFIESERPVPRFLALDQPSQVYFPPDVDDPMLEADEDRVALERMLGALHAEVVRHHGALQVIVVDHADLDVAWYQDAVVERWRGGNALVPASWMAR